MELEIGVLSLVLSTNFKYLLQHIFSVLHLNTLLREKHGVFSKEFTRSWLADPEFYLAQEIASINESLLTATQMKVLSPGKKLVGQSVIFISACTFQSAVSEKDERGKEDDTLQRKFKAATTNGQLQDQTGTLSIVCPFSIPEGTALTNVLVFYYHQLGIYRLEHSDQTPAKNRITMDVLGRLNEILRIKESV